MSIASLPTGVLLQPPPYPIWKFTVDEYHRMIQMGFLTEDDPIELLEGWLVPKMPRNTRHDVTIDKAQEVIHGKLPAGRRLRIQSAITLPDSEPEPDLAIVEGPADRYLAHHPYPEDIDNLIEVAESSLERDRLDKGRIYARARIAIYWIINLVDRQVEVFTDPTGPDAVPRYQQHQDYDENASVPLVIGGKEIGQVPVRDILP